jgi:cysteinyl-tRNA synthetase
MAVRSRLAAALALRLRRNASSLCAAPPQLRVYDSLTRRVAPLAPSSHLLPGALTWYACGPTVYAPAHAGHARCYVTLDVLRRLAQALTGRAVLLALNVTDVDDKIIARAAERGEAPLALARRCERGFFADMRALRVAPPCAAPRVSEHVACIVDYARAIEAKGLAYVAADGSGLYLDTRALAARGFGYGRLAPRAVEAAAAAEAAAAVAADALGSDEDAGVDDGVGGVGAGISRSGVESVSGGGASSAARPGVKRSPRDFALWKAAPPSSALAWDSPWGRGRPGWHIECSAMAHAVFGARLDLHAGGADLAFPHHCNELAQAQAFYAGATGSGGGGVGGDGDIGGLGSPPPEPGPGQGWVGHWLHTGHVHIAGRKMSKSLKNFVTVRDMLAEGEAAAAEAGEGGAEAPPPAGGAPSSRIAGADAFRVFCLQHHYATHLTFLPQTSLREAVAVARRLREPLRIAARVLAGAQRGGGGEGCSRWGPREHALAHSAQAALAAAACSYAGDFDTPAALRSLGELGAALRAYAADGSADARLLAWSARGLADQLALVGLGFGEALAAELGALAHGKGFAAAGACPGAGDAYEGDEEPGPAAEAAGAAPPAAGDAARPAVDALVALRGAVRAEAAALGRELKKDAAEAGGGGAAAALAAAQRRLMALSDAARDTTLPALGFAVTDTPRGPELTRRAGAPPR